MNCKECKHWTVPTWDTKGFGTCYLSSSMRDQKKEPLFKVSGGGYLTTYETFGCVGFEEKPKAADKK